MASCLNRMLYSLHLIPVWFMTGAKKEIYGVLVQLKTWFQKCMAQCSTHSVQSELLCTDPVICHTRAVSWLIISGIVFGALLALNLSLFASANCLTHAGVELLGLTTADEFDTLVCHSSCILTVAEFENRNTLAFV